VGDQSRRPDGRPRQSGGPDVGVLDSRCGMAETTVKRAGPRIRPASICHPPGMMTCGSGPNPAGFQGLPTPWRRPLRLLALAVTAALALPAMAVAQTLPALPALDETPAQRTARRAAMTPPVPQEDA